MARASHWEFSASSSSGTRTAKINGVAQTEAPWTPPSGVSTNTMVVSMPEVKITGGTGTITAECHAKINLHVTATWVADPAGDPAPASVWFIESSSASWGGTGVTTAGGGGGGIMDGRGGPGADAKVRVCRYGKQPRPASVRALMMSPPSDYMNGDANDGIDGGCTGVGGCTSQPPPPPNPAPVPPATWHKKTVSGGALPSTTPSPPTPTQTSPTPAGASAPPSPPASAPTTSLYTYNRITSISVKALL